MTTRIRLGVFSPSVLLSVARDTGRLDEQDLEVDEVPVTSSPAQFSSLLAGELDVALTSPDNVLAYRFDPGNPLGATADVRIVSTVDRGLGLALYARPGLDRLEPGPGALRFGVDVPTSGFALAMYALAESLGLDRTALQLATLGSTPRRLEALLAGDCDATMLNAGNELLAEDAGCRLLASVADVCSPYVGTVVCVRGDEHLAAAHRLASALRLTAGDVVEGRSRRPAVARAADRLDLPEALALRYVARMSSPSEGLLVGPEVDREGLRTIVDLRRRFLPRPAAPGSGDGDVLDSALEDAAGLVARAPAP